MPCCRGQLWGNRWRREKMGEGNKVIPALAKNWGKGDGPQSRQTLKYLKSRMFSRVWAALRAEATLTLGKIDAGSLSPSSKPCPKDGGRSTLYLSLWWRITDPWPAEGFILWSINHITLLNLSYCSCICIVVNPNKNPELRLFSYSWV